MVSQPWHYGHLGPDCSWLWDLPWHRRMFSRTPGLCLLDASNSPPAVMTKNVSRPCQMSPGGKKNHSCLRVTALYMDMILTRMQHVHEHLNPKSHLRKIWYIHLAPLLHWGGQNLMFWQLFYLIFCPLNYWTLKILYNSFSYLFIFQVLPP